MAKSGKMTIFTLSMMTVAAVVSLRGLPLMAKEGLSMIFYILFAAVMFLIPASLVAAELGGAFSNKSGGVYTWIKEAFGSRWGFTAIWLQWIQNVVWYPTVLAFAASALAYLFMDPELANDGPYTGIVILVCYWGATFMTMAGTDVASKVTKYGVILGTLLPGVIIIALGLFWVIQGNPIHFLEPSTAVVTAEKLAGEAPHARLFPHITGLGSVAFLAGIVLLFAGVEVHAVHANEMKNPAKEFPASMFLAAAIIFCLFLAGSMAVAAVIPESKISLTAGLMQAFKQVLDTFHLGFITRSWACCARSVPSAASCHGSAVRAGAALHVTRRRDSALHGKGQQQGHTGEHPPYSGCHRQCARFTLLHHGQRERGLFHALGHDHHLYLSYTSSCIRLRSNSGTPTPELPRSYKVPGG